MGCHFFLQCMKVKSESEVAQSCSTLRDTMDCSPPGSSVHGIFQARVLEWGAIPFSHNTLLCEIAEKAMAPPPVLLPGKSHDGGAWWVTVHGVAKIRTRLSDFTFTFHFHALEKEIATHSSVLAWRIQGRWSLVGCRLWGRTESDTTEAT